MKHLSKYLIATLFFGPAVLGQTNPHQQLQAALLLEQQGQFAKVIETIQPLVRPTDSGSSATLDGTERANAFIMLGVAYESGGNFSGAQRSYDQALRLLENDPQHTTEYAAALENYGRLYSNLGRLDDAESMWRKALQWREQNGDHSAAMRSLDDLAGLALTQQDLRAARQYLRRASEQMKLADTLTDDDFAVVSETRGWLELSEGHAAAAITEYQRALEVCRRVHGDHHWLVGWEHMLLGKAYDQAGDTHDAVANMREGLEIIGKALGTENPKYFASELVYARVLDQVGAHTEAVSLRSAAERAKSEFYATQCATCAVNKSAFR